MKLYCATGNAGKIREFRLAAERAGCSSLQVSMLPGIETLAAPEETGSTFEENARLKAAYYSRGADQMVFAEDSGLSVDALGGAPGVYSARFSGPAATDESNNRLLLERLSAEANRKARYVCVIALARNGRVLSVFRGEVEGEIASEPAGSGGFGYDPYFFYPPFGATFAEVSAERKLSVSHRGAAFAAMLEALSKTKGTGA